MAIIGTNWYHNLNLVASFYYKLLQITRFGVRNLFQLKFLLRNTRYFRSYEVGGVQRSASMKTICRVSPVSVSNYNSKKSTSYVDNKPPLRCQIFEIGCRDRKSVSRILIQFLKDLKFKLISTLKLESLTGSILTGRCSILISWKWVE